MPKAKVAKAKTITMTEDALNSAIEKAASAAAMKAVERYKSSTGVDGDIPEEPKWVRDTKGPTAGKIKFTGKLPPQIDRYLPEQISDWFMEMQTKKVVPYTRELALYQDDKALVPCAANGGLYYGKRPNWLPHPKTDKMRKPLILTRMFIDNRIPGVTNIGRKNNDPGWLIVHVNGRPANFFASELPLGLPKLGGNWAHDKTGDAEPAWNKLPITFSTGE